MAKKEEIQTVSSFYYYGERNQNQNQKELYCQVRFYTYEEFAVVMLVHAVNKLLKVKI